MRYRRCAIILVFVLLLFSDLAGAQIFGKRGQAATPSGSDAVELVSAGDHPVFRYPVAHQHAASGCGGYLYFSRDTIRYEVVHPESDKGHSFEYKRSDLTVAGQWRFWGQPMDEAEFKFRNGTTYHFFRVRKAFVDASTSTRLGWSDVLPHQELVDAAMDFDGILDKIQAREARLHPAAPPAPPPVISMLDPVGAEAGKALDVAAARISLRGVASHASGVASVTVNNFVATLKSLAPTTMEFNVPDFAVNAGASAIVIVATATDKSQSQMIFTLNRPDVRVLDPVPNAETDRETVKVRGIAAGFRAIDRIEVAGRQATFHSNPAGEVEFEADAVPLTVGANTLQGFVVGRDGTRLPFKLDVKRNPPPGPPPLALSEVADALQKGVPAARVASLVSQFGVSFALTDDAEKQLRAAGADTNLLLVIAKSRK
ncbi:MAG: hypothetical protein LAN37_06370 [Acidobacteriia bacterium]|nr:hypothetical protein [Terriglobia bacterium]